VVDEFCRDETVVPRTASARFFAAFIGYPKTCVFVLLAMTLCALGGYFDPQWPQRLKDRLFVDESGAEQSAPLDSEPEPARPRRSGNSRVARTALGQADAFMVIQSSQFFTSQGADALRAVVAALEASPTVAGVTWMDNAPPLNIFGLAEPVIPRSNASPQRFAVAREKAVKHPLIVGQFLSPDAETALLLIRFDWVFVQQDSDCTTGLIEIAEKASGQYPDVAMQFSVTGPVPIRLMLIQNRQSNQFRFQLIGYGIILLMAAILFRGLSVVLVVALAPALGVFWTLGLIRYFDLQTNPFSDVILPVLLSLVGFTDSVHMMVYVRKQMHHGSPAMVACKAALGAVGLACFLTSLTTAIGMGSLSLAHHEVVQEFGWACVIGVFSTWLSVMLVVPLACCTPWSRRLAKGADRGFVESNLNYFTGGVSWFLKHSRATSYAAVGLLCLLCVIASSLRPDDRKSNLMPTGSAEQLALAHLDRSMGGLDVCSAELRWDDPELRPESIAEAIMEIDKSLLAEPLIGHPLSICRLLAALPGEESPAEKMSMIELLPPPLKLALFDQENRKATITFRVQDLGTAAYKPVFETLEGRLQEIVGKYPGLGFELIGEPIWRWRDLYQVVMDLTTSLGTAFVIIVLVLAVAFKSLRIGLISIVPNALPLAAAATYLVIVGQPLEIVSVCAFTICLGIAVDDTIHFIARYREESHATARQSGDLAGDTASRAVLIERAFHGVGTGLIMTTIVLVTGFSSVLSSETRDHRVFASLGIITLVTALLCDLFLLPALLAYFDRPDRAKQVTGDTPQ
jgi:predicted RND superfamily exporter protein